VDERSDSFGHPEEETQEAGRDDRFQEDQILEAMKALPVFPVKLSLAFFLMNSPSPGVGAGMT